MSIDFGDLSLEDTLNKTNHSSVEDDLDLRNDDPEEIQPTPSLPSIIELKEIGFKKRSYEYAAAKAAVAALSENPSEPAMYVVSRMYEKVPKKYKRDTISLEKKLHKILRTLMIEGVFVKMNSLYMTNIWRGKNYDAVARGERISYNTDTISTRI